MTDRHVLLAAALALALALGVIIGRADAPRCPVEDSCRAEYSAGQWHIVEVAP